jgi:hypothetical protein
MKEQGKTFIRITLFVILGSFVLNSVGFAELAKPVTAQPFSIDLFSKQQAIQPTTSLVVTNPGSVPTRFTGVNLGSQSAPRNPDRYVHNSWLNGIIDQATAESTAIAYLKKTVTPLNFDDYQLSSVKLVNSLRGKEYKFEWTPKPTVNQTLPTLGASVNAKTGRVTQIWVLS